MTRVHLLLFFQALVLRMQAGRQPPVCMPLHPLNGRSIARTVRVIRPYP
jgi:hypothetical protein